MKIDKSKYVVRTDGVLSVTNASPEPKVPSTPVKAARFLQTVYRHIRSGRGFLPKEDILKRLAVCESCDQFTGKRCNLCGCCVEGQQNFLNKLAYPHESCPLKKWGPDGSDTTV